MCSIPKRNIHGLIVTHVHAFRSRARQAQKMLSVIHPDPDYELCSQTQIVLNSSQVTISKEGEQFSSFWGSAEYYKGRPWDWFGKKRTSSRDQFQRYGQQLLAKEMPACLDGQRGETERENSDHPKRPTQGGERGKFCSRTNPRSAVTHILKKKGCNSVREPLTQALLSQHGTLSLWPSVTIADAHREERKVLWGSPGLHLHPSPPLCSL